MKILKISKEEKIIKIINLLENIDDLMLQNFFDLESEKILDLKIEVLTKLANGVKPSEIKEYYDILELYPNNVEIWD